MVSRSAGSEPTGRRAVRLVLPFLALLLAAAPALGQSAGGLAPATGQEDGFGGTALPDAGAVDSAPIEPIAPVEGVEAESLPPVLTADGAGLPAELWQGIGVEEVDGLFSKLDIPPRSAALHSLWRRLLTADVTPPAAGKVPGHFEALRLEGMTRTGLLEAAMQLIAKEGAAAASPLALTAKARTELGLGKTDAACATAKGLPLKGNSLPGRIREEALLIVAYCVAKDRKPDRAALAAEVLRSEKVKAPLALAVLDSLADGKTPKLPKTEWLRLIDYRYLSLLGRVPGARVAGRASPDLLAAIIADPQTAPADRAAVAEAAARLHVIDAAALATIFQALPFEAADRTDPIASPLPGALKRALLLQAALAETAPPRRAQLAAALLESARAEGLLVIAAGMVAPAIESLPQSPDLAWFTETAIEALIAAGRYDVAVGWVLFGGSTAGPGGNAILHWMTLIDIADAKGSVPHGSTMQYAEEMAAAGAFSPDMLQRLATVLDALGYNVPIPVWEGAQNAPKSDQGHLPETGLLSDMQAAAGQRAYARTILLAMAALGGDGAEGAHMLALGDSIRALKAIGLEADARRLGLEALFAGWPRRPKG